MKRSVSKRKVCEVGGKERKAEIIRAFPMSLKSNSSHCIQLAGLTAIIVILDNPGFEGALQGLDSC